MKSKIIIAIMLDNMPIAEARSDLSEMFRDESIYQLGAGRIKNEIPATRLSVLYSTG